MIAFSLHHCVDILFPPVVEEPRIIKLGFADLPDIKGLIQHQQSQPVASIQEGRRRWIVRCADSVVSSRFQQLRLPLLSAVKRSRSQWPVVVMHASPRKLDRFAIEPKSLLDRPAQRANAKWRHQLVYRPAIADDRRFGAVQKRALRR